MNAMREIKVEKIVMNMGCGDAGEKLEKAQKLLATVTGKKVTVTHTHDRTRFGMPKGRQIGVKITFRGKEAEDMLKRLLDAVDNKLRKKTFDKQGNFSFGIKEYVDIPGTKYDPNMGMYGMDVCVTLMRPGFRVKRKRNGNKVGKKHRITSDEAREFIVKKYNIKVEE